MGKSAWGRKERFGSLVADSPVGFLIVQGGKVVFMNPAQERIFGNIPVPFDLGTLDPRVHREDRGAFLRLLREDFASQEPRTAASLRFFPPGRPAGSAEFAWIHCQAVPIRYRDGDALLVNMIDAAPARGLDQTGIAGGMASLEKLAAGLAHEIRNPLSGINLDISSLEKLVGAAETLDDEKRRTARRIASSLRKNSDRIEAIVRRVMGVSHPQAPQCVSSDVNRCVESAVALSSTALARNGIRIRVRLADGLPAVHADLRLLEDVLLNLLANAVEAVSRVDRPKEIELASGERDGCVVIRVADSGPGVPESLRKTIFSPFFTTRRGATGIGLWFSHRVIADHGGTLTVGTSDLGGAEFRIELPVARDRAGGRSGAGG